MGTRASGAVRAAGPEREPADDPRVVELVKEYEAAWERGRPDRSRFQARHPHLASVVALCLDGIDILYQEVAVLTRADRSVVWAENGLIGARVGEFEVVREIARGGMGVVYEALQPALNRRVALKILPRSLATDRDRLRRFEVEARAAAAVAHPHIVPVYAVGEDRGVNYYAMQFVDGASLDALIGAYQPTAGGEPTASRPSAPERGGESILSPEELVDLRRQNRPAFHRAVARLGALVARALDHAHQNGVVHRDIKPANLLLGRDGHIWVTDFGLAQFTDAATMTGTGTAIGTLRYMSPEQAEGDRRRLDHRADVYSLAATLYELSTGRPAFPAETPAALLLQIARGTPPIPRSIDPTVPRDLEAVLLKGLETDPRDRYATAAEFAGDLDRFLNRRPIAARRPCAGDRARKWMGRHPAVVAGAAIALVLLTAASGAIAALNQRAYRAERDRADEAERRFYQSKQLGDLMIQISEEEGRSNVSFHGPRRRLLLAALENYRQLNEAGHNDPQVRAELDRATARVEELLAEEKAARESWRVGLLWFQPVRAELRLSPDQEEQVQQSFRVRGLEPGTTTAGLGMVRDDLNMRGKIARLLSDPAARNELLRPLTGPQRKRLGELFLRCLGPMAFGDPEIVEALGLTPPQRQQIRLLQPPVALRLGPPFAVLLDDRRPGGIDPASDPVALLTSEQRAIWKALIGRPFEMPW